MRKILALIVVLFALNVGFATVSVIEPPRVKASDILIPIGTTGAKISMLDLATMKIKDIEQITGKKMNFKDRIAFKLAQKQVRNNIAPDGTFETKKIQKFLKKQGSDEGGGFHVGGFALGLLLGLIGVIIAYIINDDKKRSRRLWAWIGWGVWIVICLLFFL